MSGDLPTVVIPGGSGYLGRLLTQHWAGRGYRVVVLSRRGGEDHGRVLHLPWDGERLGPWARELEGAEAVLNMAGRSVNCRYHARNRREIYDSRLRSTRVLGEAIAACARPPRTWINAASATIYRHALDRPMDEATGELGKGFSVDVCLQWERTLAEADTPRTRKVALRTAMVLGEGHGGVMDAFLRIVRLGLGGTLGPGNQFVSWVHAEDFVRTIDWVVEHEVLEGAVNCTSPHPVPNAEFMRTLRQVCRQPLGLPATRWMLEIGAVLLRTETELLLKSRRVVPRRLLESGFVFRYPELRPALEQIVNGKAAL